MDEPHHCRLYNWLVQSHSIPPITDQIDSSKILQRLVIDIDSLALLEFDSYLGNCLIGNYQLFCTLLQEVLFEVLQESVDSKNQICCVVRPTPVLNLDHKDVLTSADSTALVSYWGSIISIKKEVEYTQSTKYRCSVDTCVGVADASHIRIYTPYSLECDVINPRLHCTCCREVLYEDVANRTIGRRASASLRVFRSKEEKKYFVEETLDIVVRDELLSSLKLGGRVAVVGLQISQANYPNLRSIVEVVSLRWLELPVPHLIPRSVQEIFSVRERSPWQFLSLLAFCINPHSLVQGSYHTLKQLLLLSLVRSAPVTDRASPLYLPTAHPQHCPGLNILVEGRDTRLINIVLQHFSQLAASRSVCGRQPLSGTRDDLCVEAGPLLTSPGGVVLVGDLDFLKKEDLAALNTTLQNRAVIVGKKRSEIFVLRSVIWGYRQDKTRKTPPPASDIIYKVSKDCNEDMTIEGLLNEESFEMLPDLDVTAYITLASTIDVQFEESCTRLIVGYCQASKSVRYGSGYELPVNAPYTLHLLAANHARLNLRNQVLDVDAVIAIKLFEESLFSSQRYSTLDVTLATHVDPGDEDRYLGDNVDTSMEKFYTKTVQFCSTHIPGFTVDNEQ